MKAGFSVRPPAAFRGTRDYYHSTDLYEAVVAALDAHGLRAGAFDLKLRERITTQPRIDFHPATDAPQPHAAATASFDIGGQRWVAQVVAEDAPIAARKPYDEAPVWSRTRQDGRAFAVEACAGFAPIEVVTAVAVHAHRVLFPPAAGKRWMLAQLSASRLLARSETEFFRFEIVRQTGGALTQGVMSDRTGAFGKMMFVLK